MDPCRLISTMTSVIGSHARWRGGARVVEMDQFIGGSPSMIIAVSLEEDAMAGGNMRPLPARANSWLSSMEKKLNSMSVWLVVGGFSFAAVCKRDVEVMWGFLGAIVNNLLSRVLKKKLNHERPTPGLRSDPGMPSSHAQTLFYGAAILDFSLFYWLGTDSVTMILLPAIVSAATYLSKLRVSYGYHTLNQVIVGAAVGFAFAALWFGLWHSVVQEALSISPLVKNTFVVGSVVVCFGSVTHHWLKENRSLFRRR